jgi:ribosomal protein S4
MWVTLATQRRKIRRSSNVAVIQRVRQALADALPPSAPTKALATARLRRRLDRVIHAVNSASSVCDLRPTRCL